MVQMDVSQVLARMRAIDVGQPASKVSEAESGTSGASFQKLLTESIDMVNDAQTNARDLKTAFQTGDKTVELPEVMIAVQKASISFEAMNQVRNKLLSAYQEIMNMPV
ncbi:MAG: flagellar hook-basal body complex protein FliE [Pseudomonadales bacterium]|nr:flagellar hook-basal body complex protein FliE [Pseudomonadales bacterium]